MSNNDPRGTDKTFYQLMQLSGDALLKLFGVPAEQAKQYIFRATVVKQVTLQPDIEGILFFDNTESGRAYIEFQGYLDKLIRQRLVANIALSCLHTEYTGPVTAAIIYTDKDYQTDALPLCQVNGAPFIKLKEIVLSGYTEKKLLATDPRLLVLVPFTLKNPRKETTETLQPKVERWRTQLAAIYPSQEYSGAVYLMSMFLLSRCKKLNYEEVHKMFHVDLMDTQAGQDILAIGIDQGRQEGKQEGKREGIKEGRREGMQRGIKKGRQEGIQEGRQEGKQEGQVEMSRALLLELLVGRFGEISEVMQQRIEVIESVDELKQLFKEAMQCQDLAAFEAFLGQLH